MASRDVLYMIAWREVRIKYKQSVMGILWAILMPMVIVFAGVVVRYAVSMVSGKALILTDIMVVSVKAVPWAFVVSSIRFATASLIANTNLVTKIYLPREVFPIAAVLSQLMDFGVAAAVLAVGLAVVGVGWSLQLLWVPVLLLILIVFTTGLGILLSAGSLFFRDVKYLVEIGLTFAIFFTPVFYSAATFSRWTTWLMLNPIAPLLEGLATAVVAHQPPSIGWTLYSGAVAAVTLTVALTTFRKLEPYFAESV